MPKILIVDDEWLTRLEIEEMLTDLGYEVSGQAETGEAAVAMSRELNPDLIIMDVMMPGEMNGVDAARVIKAESGTPIIFVTGYGDPEYIEAAKEIAPFGYVMKPFDEREIYASVEIALSKRELELKLERTNQLLERTNLDLQEEIAARKKTEKALRESEFFFSQIFEQSSISTTLHKPDGTIYRANGGFCKMFGIEEEGILNAGYNLFKDQAAIEAGVVPLLRDIFLEKKARKWETMIDIDLASASTGTPTSRTGKIFLEVYGYPVLNHKGDLEYVVLQHHDITERKQAEDALIRSEKRFRAIIDASPVPMALNDEAQKITYLNQAFVQTFGYRQEDIPTLDLWWSKAYPDSRYRQWVSETWQAELQKGKRSGTAFSSMEVIVRCKNGKRKTALVNAAPLANAFMGEHLVVLYDITERKQAEEKINELNRDFMAFLENTNDFVYFKDQNSRFRFCSQALADLTGHAGWRDMVGKHDLEVFPKDTARIYHEEELPIFREGKPLLNKIDPYYDAQGNKRWVVTNKWPLFNHAGEVVGLFGSSRDITENKRMEEELRESEERYRVMMEHAADAVFLHDEFGRILDVNQKACKSLGYSREEMLSMSIRDIDPDAVQAEEHGKWDAILAGGNLTLESTNICKDGSVLWVEVALSSVNLKTGPAILGIVRDITERRRLESQLQQSQKMEAMGNLAGGIAHEFNNILGIILGNAELAMGDVPDWSPAKESLEEIRNASFRAKDVVQQILRFTRKTMTALKPLEINTIAREALKLMRASIPAMVDVQPNIPSSPSMILGDPTEIHQVVINLCANAAHAMKASGGRLDVGISEVTLDEKTASFYEDLSPGDFVKLTVKDSGEGISPDVLEKVFEPYFTTKDFGQGSGMGLSVVYGIVKKCKGAIKMESTVGEGTVVEVLFPKITEEVPVEEKIEGELPRGDERILFVDDDPSIVSIISQMLERLGYKVTGMTDSTAALAHFKWNRDDFDLVITDMAMPNMSGDRFAAELMRVRKDIPILLCTGHSDTVDEKKAKAIGIKGFAMKPLHRGRLARAVRTVLDE